jgi:hypothetical protein
MQKPIRNIRAGQLPPTELPSNVEKYLRANTPVVRRIDVDHKQPGGIYFSEESTHISTPESRKERAYVWRHFVLPSAIVTASIIAALWLTFFGVV